MSLRNMHHGYALVSVLWLVILLTAVTGAYHAQARVEARLLAAALHRAQAEALAEAGIWTAVREHFIRRANEANPAPRSEHSVTVNGRAVAITVADVSGFVNLNNAQGELLAAVLAAQSDLSATEQAPLVDAILDWRDADDARHPAGAEDPDYASRSAGYGAKDAPFATVDELRLVRGMTPELYRAIAPLLTVYGQNARVNVAAAPAEVLRALPGADESTLENVLRERSEPATGAANPGDLFDQRFVQQVGEDIYTVTAVASVAAVTARVVATLRYARGEVQPVQVLAWSNAPAGGVPQDGGPNGR